MSNHPLRPEGLASTALVSQEGHRRQSPRRRSRGFTLLELLVTITIVAIMTGMAQIAFLRMQKQGAARNGMRHMQSIFNEARNTAQILGAAAGTQRVRAPQHPNGGPACPMQFRDAGPCEPGTACRARAGVQINVSTNTVTFISQVERVQVIPAPDDPLDEFPYNIYCRTVDFDNIYKNNVDFLAGTSSPPPVNNLWTLTYDSRGFINNLTQATAAIGMAEVGGRALQQRILVMASGYSCIESSPQGLGGSVVGSCR